MLEKLKRRLFDYEEVDSEKGYGMSSDNKNKDELYSVYVRDKRGVQHILYDYSNRGSVNDFKPFTTYSPDIIKMIKEDFYSKTTNFKIYRIFRIKRRYCLIHTRWAEETDVWLSSITRPGLAILLTGIFMLGSLLLFILFLCLRELFSCILF